MVAFLYCKEIAKNLNVSVQVVGDGSVAQYVLSGKAQGSLGINFLSVNVAWGVAVAMGVYVSAGVSGK